MTNATLKAGADVKEDLKRVTLPMGDLEDALKRHMLPVEVDLRGKINVTEDATEGLLKGDIVEAVIWITEETSETFSATPQHEFIDALSDVLHLPPR
jgi:hypothetical protein